MESLLILFRVKHNFPCPSTPRQSGNVLFLILIAVALFAALSFVVSKSSRGTGDSGANEKASLGAGRILNFGSNMQAAISRFMITKGKEITDIKFNNDIYKYMDGNNLFPVMGTPADPKPYIFHPQGGAIIPLVFTDLSAPCPTCASATSTAPGHMNMVWVNIPEVGTSTADPAMVILSLSDATCNAINAKLSLGVSSPPVAAIVLNNFQGTTSPPATALATGAGVGTITGKTEFCYRESGGNQRYNFIRILAQN